MVPRSAVWWQTYAVGNKNLSLSGQAEKGPARFEGQSIRNGALPLFVVGA